MKAKTLNSVDRQLIWRLLLSANESIETDVVAARQCIERARALLNQSVALQRAVGDEIRAQRGGLAPWQVQQTVIYIEDHLGERIRVDDLAIQVGLSASHLFKAFKETFGQAPMVYVAWRRIQRAKELMASSEQSLAHIALECGLCDQAHFTRMFKRVVGDSPSAWRHGHFAVRSGAQAASVGTRSDIQRPYPTPEARPSI